jgi:hypothetical protein
MHITILKILLLALLAGASVARAECTFPKAPTSIPDGKTAAAEEMMAAMQAFKSYQEEVTAFGACLDEETRVRAASTAQLMQLKTMQAKKHNAAVAELQDKARQFNEQVRIFKGRTG